MYHPRFASGMTIHAVTKGLTPVQLQAKQLWQAVLGDMQVRLSKNAFENWLRPTSLVGFSDDVATISAPNTFGASTLESRYSTEIQRVLSEIIGRPVSVRFTVGGSESAGNGPVVSTGTAAPAAPAANGAPPARRRIDTTIRSEGKRSSPASQQLELSSSPFHGLNSRYVYET